MRGGRGFPSRPVCCRPTHSQGRPSGSYKVGRWTFCLSETLCKSCQNQVLMSFRSVLVLNLCLAIFAVFSLRSQRPDHCKDSRRARTGRLRRVLWCRLWKSFQRFPHDILYGCTLMVCPVVNSSKMGRQHCSWNIYNELGWLTILKRVTPVQCPCTSDLQIKEKTDKTWKVPPSNSENRRRTVLF